jgi:hypothetical protein
MKKKPISAAQPPKPISMSSKDEYVLKLNGSQLAVVNEALRLLSKLGRGQFFHLLDMEGFKGREDKLVSLTGMKSRDGFLILGNPEIRMDQLLDALKLGMTDRPLNSSPGIYNQEVPGIYRKAYDIHQVIRKKLADDMISTGWNVDQYEFNPTDPSEPPVEISRSK